MKHVRIMLAAAGLFVASGTPGSVRAESAVTLYTPPLRASSFHCDAVNAGRKTLQITISIIAGKDGSVLADTGPVPIVLDPATEASGNFGNVDSTLATDGYCEFRVLGTADRSDLRTVLKANLIRTFNEGARTNIPVFLTGALEGR